MMKISRTTCYRKKGLNINWLFFYCLLQAILVISFGSPAMAEDVFPQTGALYQIVYNNTFSGGTEIMTKLCSLSSLDGENVTLTEEGTISTDLFSEISGWSELNIEFCGIGDEENLYFAKIVENAEGLVSVSAFSTFYSSFYTCLSGYNYVASASSGNIIGENTISNVTSDYRSYRSAVCDGGYTLGFYAGLNAYDTTNGYGDLSVLTESESDTAYVDMYLFHAQDQGGDYALIGNGEDEYLAVLRFFENGKTVLNPGLDDGAEEVPDRPEIEDVADQVITEGETFSITVTLSNETTVDTWALSGCPEEMTISDGGVITWVDAVSGEYGPVTVTASNTGGSDETSFILSVTADETEENDSDTSSSCFINSAL